MDEHTLKLLEFDRIQAWIAALTVMEATRDEVTRQVRPTTDRVAAEQRLRGISEMIGLMRRDLDLPILAMSDPRPALKRAHIEDSAMTGADLRQVAVLLRNAAGVQRFLKTHRDDAPQLVRVASSLLVMSEAQADLERAIDDEGRVADDASSELRTIRRSIQQTMGRIEKRLGTLLRDPDLQDAFSGDRPTHRSGRMVLPMKNNRWTAVGGLVHDRSHTGQTFFVEPAATIEMGNELQNLAAEEEAEVRRILLRLTSRLRPHLDELADSFRALMRIDLLRAAARFAQKRGMEPAEVLGEGGRLELVEARHPILESTLETDGRHDAMVPLSVHVPRDTQVLAITGSNTGGKTVALKTVGLLALMAQAGLPVPARRAALPVFDQVLVDIGDEQSIEQSLSTFSGHMAQVVAILQRATDRSLVLMDELGSGTDPAEGGALACAILDSLARRRSTVLVTTHLREVKIFCHEQPGMQNAAMEFNAETLRPTYRLMQGEPGQSHALTIAERLGLPSPVIKRARGFLSDEHLNLESLLGRMSEERRRLREELDTAERDRKNAAEQRERLEAELAASKQERKALLQQAYREASGIVDNTKREMQKVIREAREKVDDTREVEALRQNVQDKKRRLSRGSERVKQRQRRRLRPETLGEGQLVYVESFRNTGTIEGFNRQRTRVMVNVGGLSVEVKTTDLSEPEPTADDDEPRGRPVSVTPASATVEMELNLIGQRVVEALEHLDRFLDRAAVAGLERVQVVHGRGTGTLMRAVHEALRDHPLVESYRSGDETEGGIAVTVATLKE